MTFSMPYYPSRRTAFVAAAVMLGAATALGWHCPARSALSYLFAFIFFTGLAVGSLALLLVHGLTGGQWWQYLRGPLFAAARTLPLQAVLALPLLGAIHLLYPWARADTLTTDPLLRQQLWYLNPEFFVIRTIVYFVLWLTWLYAWTRRARCTSPGGGAGLAAGGLIVFALSTLFAATDWIVSLSPHWHSSVFGMLLATGWMLSAAAWAVLCVVGGDSGIRSTLEPQLSRDLGNLLLMFVLAWGYLAYMQYLTVWIADQPDESVWYLPRTRTSWQLLAATLVAGQFLLPFILLLSRRVKRSPAWLAAVAALLCSSAAANAFWLTVPSVASSGVSITPVDALLLLGIGALWLGVYRGQFLAEPRNARQ